jgi:hypothetical protein
VGSKPDEVNEFFPIRLILPALLRRGVYSVSNRNKYQEQRSGASKSRAWPVRRADNLIDIFEPRLSRRCGILNI